MNRKYKTLSTFLVLVMLFPLGCKKSQVTDKDGNIYKTVTIGEQEWTAENLNVEHYRNGDVIPQVQDYDTWYHLTTGAWCYYENNERSGKIYGKLYNWYAVNDPRGFAPEGWHIPSISEWMTLTYYLGGKDEAGGKLKKDTTLWKSPNNGATNESGFSALPGGVREYRKGFRFLGEYSYLWSSEELLDDYRPLYFYLGYDYSNICRGKVNYYEYGMSIRCIKNYQEGKEIQEEKVNHYYTKHSNFNMFWKDFQKAIYKGDKNAVLKMTRIPFIDKNRDIYDDASGSSWSLTSLSEEEFLDNYDRIFDVCATKIIKTAKFKTLGVWEFENFPTKGPGLYKLSKDAYLLEVECMEPHLFIFEKKDGVFKLTYVPYQE